MICEMCADTAEDQCVHCLRAERDRLREAVQMIVDGFTTSDGQFIKHEILTREEYGVLVAALQEEDS